MARVVTLFRQCVGDALGSFVDLFGNLVADGPDFIRKIDVDVADGSANLFGVIDQRFALRDDAVDQAAHTHFVVGVGALKLGDFGVDHSFEFAGAGECTLDTVTDGGNFAAHGLADAHDGVAGNRFRLGEADGDLRHRLADETQFLRARQHGGEEEEQRNRRQQSGDKAGNDRDRCFALAENVAEFGAVDTQGDAGKGDAPANGEQPGNHIGCAARAALQRTQELTDAFAVVIGGKA